MKLAGRPAMEVLADGGGRAGWNRTLDYADILAGIFLYSLIEGLLSLLTRACHCPEYMLGRGRYNRSVVGGALH